MALWIFVNEKGLVDGWSSQYMDGAIEVDLDVGNPLLNRLGSVRYKNGVLFEDESVTLEKAVQEKDRELNEACKQAIIDGFIHNINGIDYRFSLDMEAQMNFQGAERLLSAGAIEEIYWTVRTMDGEYTRIPINKEVMIELSIKILTHKDGMISRYRDILMPYVKSLRNVKEIESVNWNSRVYSVAEVNDILKY